MRVNYSVWFSLLILTFFMLVAWGFGMPSDVRLPNALFDVLFGAFFSDPRTIAIFALIGADVATGVVAALILQSYDLQRLASFARNTVVPYIWGWFLIYAFLYSNIQWNELLVAWLASFAWGIIMASLFGSIVNNCNRMMPTSATSDDETKG